MKLERHIGVLVVPLVGILSTAACMIGTPGQSSTAAQGSTTASSSTAVETAPTTTAASSTSEDTGLSSTATTLSEETTGTGDICPTAQGVVLNSKSWKNPGRETPYSLMVQGEGRLLAAMHVQNPCKAPPNLTYYNLGDDDGDTILCDYGANPVIVEYDTALGFVRSRVMDASDPASISQMVADDQENMYIVGTFQGYLNLPDNLWSASGDKLLGDNVEPDATYNGFAAKFDVGGNLVWSTAGVGDLTGTNKATGSDVVPYAIAVGADGRVVIGGWYRNGSLVGPTFDDCPSSPLATSNMFIRMHEAPALDPVWSVCALLVDESSSAFVYSLAQTQDGSVLAAGGFSGEIVFGDKDDPTSHATAVKYNDAFIAMWDADGRYLWHATWGSDADEAAAWVEVGPDGQAFVVGGDLSDGAATTPGQAFVKAFTPTAAGPVWGFERRLLAGEEGARSYFGQVRVDACGDVVVTGTAEGVVLWDTNDLWEDSKGGADLMIAKLRNGLPVWGHRLGSTDGDETATALALDASGFVFVGARFQGEVQLSQGTSWPAPEDECSLSPSYRGDAALLLLSP